MSKALKTLRILTESNIVNNLTYNKTNFSIIVESIKKIETSSYFL